jgi:hypothetical protein
MNLESANGTSYFDLSLKPNFHYIFSSWFLLNFQWIQSLKIQYCLHLRSENYKITSMQPYSLRAFQEYKERDLVPLSFWIQQLLQCRFKHYRISSMHPYSSRAFPRFQERHPWCSFCVFGSYNTTSNSKILIANNVNFWPTTSGKLLNAEH